MELLHSVVKENGIMLLLVLAKKCRLRKQGK
jgi:hypothetical protein